MISKVWGSGCENAQAAIRIDSVNRRTFFVGVIRGVVIVKHPCHRPGTRIGTSFIQDETSGSALQFSLTVLTPTNQNVCERPVNDGDCLVKIFGWAI